MAYLLSIDQGTTSSRAIVFDQAGHKLATAQKEFEQIYPADGWVEHDANVIWRDTLNVCREVLEQAQLKASDIAACGITNQRETTVVWDRATGKPVYNAIVWQDRRTADRCRLLAKDDGLEDKIQERCGLLLDPYFSATKIAWILDKVDGARARAENGELAFGTIDSWLLWNLTGGQVHATDATNAARTSIFDIRKQQWDAELLDVFRVPDKVLPQVKDSSDDFGVIQADLLGGEIPIYGVAGDQQAATVGQACFEKGMVKSTYGTGCFMVLNTGSECVLSKNKLLTTVAYRLNGETTYALEGSIFIAGAAVQWLRDSMRLIKDAAETEALASSIDTSDGVYMVPAFTGLGAPYWDPDARGALIGLTRNSGVAQIVRATLDSVCYQTRDLFKAMSEDAVMPQELRVDGGMIVNNFVLQRLADLVQVPVVRPQVVETTALGVAYLAGLKAGVYSSLEEIGELWQAERHGKPERDSAYANSRYAGWQRAVERVRAN